jgi:hypothetical protein
VPLALSSLAVVEGPGLWRATQAGEGRLVKDSFEELVAAAHPAVVADPLAGVVGGWDEPRVGGESVGAREGAQIAHGHQELLGSEDRPHTRKANEDWRLRASEKTLPELLVEDIDAILEREHLFGELKATMRAATSWAGRVTLWALAAVRALAAMPSAPWTPRLL